MQKIIVYISSAYLMILSALLLGAALYSQSPYFLLPEISRGFFPYSAYSGALLVFLIGLWLAGTAIGLVHYRSWARVSLCALAFIACVLGCICLGFLISTSDGIPDLPHAARNALTGLRATAYFVAGFFLLAIPASMLTFFSRPALVKEFTAAAKTDKQPFGLTFIISFYSAAGIIAGIHAFWLPIVPIHLSAGFTLTGIAARIYFLGTAVTVWVIAWLLSKHRRAGLIIALSFNTTCILFGTMNSITINKAVLASLILQAPAPELLRVPIPVFRFYVAVGMLIPAILNWYLWVTRSICVSGNAQNTSHTA